MMKDYLEWNHISTAETHQDDKSNPNTVAENYFT